MHRSGVLLLGVILSSCSSSTSGETGSCFGGCACYQTAETGPSQCFWAYVDGPDGGAFSCSNTAPAQGSLYDPYYFYCHVEPGFLIGYRCGAGDPSKGDAPNGCHYNAEAVTALVLVEHPAVDCGGGNAPLDLSTIATGTPAESSFEAASIEMGKPFTGAALYVRPSSNAAHPRAIFDPSDPTVIQLLSTWASK